MLLGATAAEVDIVGRWLVVIVMVFLLMVCAASARMAARWFGAQASGFRRCKRALVLR